MAIKTHEVFVDEVKALVGEEFTVLGTYTKSQTKLQIRHEKCGSVLEMTPNRFLSGDRCKICSGKFKKDTAYFKNEVNKLSDGEYELVSEYSSCHTPVIIKHKLCGAEYSTKPNNFLSGRRCPTCFKSVKLDSTAIQKRLDEASSSGEFSAASDYTAVTEKITLTHNVCGKTFIAASLQNWCKKAKKCPYCDDEIRNTEWLKRKIHAEVGEEYSLLDEYVSYTAKVRLLHVSCGNEYLVAPNHFFGMKTRCPICVRKRRESNGVIRIREYAEKHNIRFLQEATFETCVIVRHLPFDFYFEDKNLLIEFDGEQHFKPKFGVDTLLEQNMRDSFKNKWAEENGFRLLRIPYTRENEIEAILEKTFNDYPLGE